MLDHHIKSQETMMDTPTGALLNPVRPTQRDARLARRSASELSRLKEQRGAMKVTVSVGGDEAELPIPDVVLGMLQVILEEVAQGRGIALSLLDQEVSTQRGAELLNVSRPYFIKLLESGRIPFRKVGTHRRVRTADVLEYKARADAEAERAFAELVAEAQQLGMGYGTGSQNSGCAL
jgi:excisionase family DNA binding protein